MGSTGERVRKPAATAARSALAVRPLPGLFGDVLRQSGSPLPEGPRRDFEQHFGFDFSRIRVHDGTQAGTAARAAGARAFTVGNHIVFGDGKYEPERSSGRALLGHELAHAVQQRQSWFSGAPPAFSTARNALAEGEAARVARTLGSGFPSPALSAQPATLARDDDGLIDPFEGRTPEQRAADLEQVVGPLRQPLLAALDRNDGMEFLRRLRGLSESGRVLLELDEQFMSRIRARFHGRLLWSIECTLRFGPQLPVHVRQLSSAVFSHDETTTLEVLRSYNEFRDRSTPDPLPMLREEFAQSRALGEIVRVASERESARSERAATYREAHYETPQGGGPQQLTVFGGSERYDLARTASELRVVVRIQFVHPGPDQRVYLLPNDVAQRWHDGILSAWNGRFRASNGTTRLALQFVPLFFAENRRHHLVEVLPGSDRSDESHWHLEDSAETAAHEFGHMLGNPDEYSVPGTLAEATGAGLTLPEARRSSVEGIRGAPRPPRVGGYDISDSMMNDHGPVQSRHVWPVLDFYNRSMKPAGEADYFLEQLRFP